MSGHSKWSKVKHQKATTDVVKGREFTKASRAIMVAVKEGGGVSDPDKNFRLRLAIEKAREVNMPKDTITRAIIKAQGSEAMELSDIVYEAYGPGSVAMMIVTSTDNKQRTVSEIKNILDKGGGTLASPGAVSFLFQNCGLLVVDTQGRGIEEMLTIAIDVGADDVVQKDDVYEMYTGLQNLLDCKTKLEQKGIVVTFAESVMRPLTTIDVQPETAAKIDLLVQRLEDMDDVQNVYTNLE